MSGNVIIISSPSGGGKGTLIRELMTSMSGLRYSVSHTTRPIRPGETEGEHYHFVSREEFSRKIDSGGFLEHAVVHGNYYGTSLDETNSLLSDGSDVILEIDVQGAASVKTALPGAVGIFIMPPSYEGLRDRLIARATESEESLAVRLANSVGEVACYIDFDYVVVNDNLYTAVERLKAIILANRQRTTRQKVEIGAILDSFERSRNK